MTRRPLSESARRFREMVIATVWDDDRFGYVSSDSFVGTCPVCSDAVAVRFAGTAARVTLACVGGCSEAEIAATFTAKTRVVP